MFLNNIKKIFGLSLAFLATAALPALALEVELGGPRELLEQGAAGYVNYLFIFGFGLVGLLALGSMIFAGLEYILSAGNISKQEDAKDQITQALFGIGLAFISYLVLRTINPDLVKLKNPELTLFRPRIPSMTPLRLGEDASGFEGRMGDIGSMTVIGLPGQPNDPTLEAQCSARGSVGCYITTLGTGERACSCAAQTWGVGGVAGP